MTYVFKLSFEMNWNPKVHQEYFLVHITLL